MDSYLATWAVLSPGISKLRADGVEVTTNLCTDGEWPLRPDQRFLLRLACQCVLSNARDAVADGPERRVHITAAEFNGVLHLTVADSGPGIPRDVLPSVFAPFYTTRPDRMGLGLPICRAALAALAGTVHVAATGEAGTVLAIRAPVRAQTLDTRQPPQHHAPCEAVLAEAIA